ncbi:unnamed protein product, partial [Rotaria socialis]
MPNKTKSPLIAQSHSSSSSSIEPINTPLMINNIHDQQLTPPEDSL